MRHAVLFLCVSLVLSLHAQEPAAFTDPGRAERVTSTQSVVDAIFDAYRTKRHMPGFVYGVVLDGKLLYSGQFGKANLGKNIDADARSVFRIASMSKSFTALSILQLRDAGKLSLDDPASKYIPDMDGVKHLFSDAPAITIRHLLTHGAGFPEDNPWGDRQLQETEEMLLSLMKEGPAFSNVPGVAYEYSNTGFALLGNIVQRVSGMDFQEYTAKYIFEPLGMHATVWEFDMADEDHLALGYNWIDEDYVNIPLVHHGSYGAMGGLMTSIEDFANYMALHLSAWPPRNGQESSVLKRSSLREMHHPWRHASVMDYTYGDGRKVPAARAYAYGLGWLRNAVGRTCIGHSGGLPGFGSNWTMMPDYGLAIMSFDNRTYGGTTTINRVVLDSIITLAALEPRMLPVSDILQKRMDELVEILPGWEGAEASGLFAENFFMDYRLKDIVKRTAELYEEAGQIDGVGPMKPMNQLRGTFTLEGEKKNIRIFFTLTPEKEPRIQQVRIRSVEK
jgi:CubicO group peptidase (beta-lactamase class C family)